MAASISLSYLTLPMVSGLTLVVFIKHCLFLLANAVFRKNDVREIPYVA